jgi:hypothetical protein
VTPTLTDDALAPAPPPAGSPLDEPTFEECHAEFNRYHEAYKAGVVDPDNVHAGQFVAFYDGRVIGYGTDPTALRRDMSAVLGVHPARLMVEYLYVWGG